MKDFIINRAVKPLFSDQTNSQKALLLGDLKRIVPTNPRLLNKIYSCSSLGVQEKIISKFSNTRSIQRVAMDTWISEDSIHKTVESLECCVTAFYKNKSESGDVFMQKFEDIVVDFLPDKSPEGIYCITLIAQKMREYMWKLHIEGITMPPQQEQTTLYLWKNIPESLWKNTVLIQIKQTDEDRYTCRGPYNPYFGSHTGQRARKAPLQVIEVGSLISSIRMLLKLLSWVNGDNNIQKLILTCVEEKTSIPMEEVQKYSRQVYSGTITHRLSCPTLQRGGMANTN